MYQIYYCNRQSIINVTEKEFDEIKVFYKLKPYKNIYRNQRCDIYAWEAK